MRVSEKGPGLLEQDPRFSRDVSQIFSCPLLDVRNHGQRSVMPELSPARAQGWNLRCNHSECLFPSPAQVPQPSYFLSCGYSVLGLLMGNSPLNKPKLRVSEAWLAEATEFLVAFAADAAEVLLLPFLFFFFWIRNDSAWRPLIFLIPSSQRFLQEGIDCLEQSSLGVWAWPPKLKASISPPASILLPKPSRMVSGSGPDCGVALLSFIRSLLKGKKEKIPLSPV